MFSRRCPDSSCVVRCSRSTFRFVPSSFDFLVFLARRTIYRCSALFAVYSRSHFPGSAALALGILTMPVRLYRAALEFCVLFCLMFVAPGRVIFASRLPHKFRS